jgi:uronate dehydrogenase
MMSLVAAMTGIDCVVHMAGVPVEPEDGSLGQGAAGQHRRCAQPVRGRATGGREARDLRLVAPRGRLPSARPADDGDRRASAGQLLRRQQGVRRGDGPNVRRQVRPAGRVACASAPTAPSPAIRVICRSGSARATWSSWSAAVSRLRTFPTSPLGACRPIRGAFWDNQEAAAVGYVPRDNAEDWAERILASSPSEEPCRRPVPRRLVLRQGLRRRSRAGGLSLLPREAVRDCGVLPCLAPQHDLIAPRIAEGVVVAVEFRPVVVAPQQGRA